MLQRTTWMLTERRIMSGVSRRDGSVAGKLTPHRTPQPGSARLGQNGPPSMRLHSNSHATTVPRASVITATRPPRTREAMDPMDEILPAQDGLDAGFPDDISGASTAYAPRTSRRPPPRHRRSSVLAGRRADQRDARTQDEEELALDELDGEDGMGRASNVEAADADERIEEADDDDVREDEDDSVDTHRRHQRRADVDDSEQGDGAHYDDADELELSETDAAIEVGEDVDTANMEEAYRFLLHHIDAEMAAIQRRQEDVKHRRQQKEDHYRHTVKELFDMMESPWLLIPDAAGLPLPATGMDVYVKEELQKRNAKGGNHRLAEDAQNKMLHLALEKNYRSFPAARKQPYEEAAKHNTLRRQELQNRLHKGCSKFEAYLDHVKECTADMVRRGEVSEELPTASLAPSHPSSQMRVSRRSSSIRSKGTHDKHSDDLEHSTHATAPVKRAARGAKSKQLVSSNPDTTDASATTTTTEVKSRARKRVKNGAAGAAHANATDSASTKSSPSARNTKRGAAKKTSPATSSARGAQAQSKAHAKKGPPTHTKSYKARAHAAKKPASVKRSGGSARSGAKTASIPLPTIPGLRVKAKAPKTKASGGSAKSKGKKKK